jgi:hypothetical protein
VGVAEDIVISMVVFLFLSLRNTDGTVIQGANSLATCSILDFHDLFLLIGFY